MFSLRQLHPDTFSAGLRGKRCTPCATRLAVPPILLEDAARFQQLAEYAGAEVLVRADQTPLGRGLVAMQDIEKRQTLVSVPIHNALVVTDDPDNISIFGDRQHRLWQERHGQLPELLVDFLQGESRWDVRLSAWLLWVCKWGGAHGPLWQQYGALLPAEAAMSCLLNYRPAEVPELQLPCLQGPGPSSGEALHDALQQLGTESSSLHCSAFAQSEAMAQREWITYLHSKYFDAKRGELASLHLSSSVADTSWAAAMVRSRTFSEDVNGESITLMVPFSDLANHSFNNNATFAMNTTTRRFDINATQAISAGCEATIGYGSDKPNSELFRDYGFVVPGNPNDRLDLPVGEGAEALPCLNGPSLQQVSGFSGNLVEGDIPPPQPPASRARAPAATLQLSRRRCALLSLPITGAKGASSGTSARDFFAWPPTARTSSGQPDPEPVQPSQVAEERRRVERIADALRAQKAAWPTSLTSDQRALAALTRSEAGGGASRCSSSGGGSRTSDSGIQQSPVRLETALRARIEAKLLVREGLWLLDEYDQHLAGMLQ